MEGVWKRTDLRVRDLVGGEEGGGAWVVEVVSVEMGSNVAFSSGGGKL